MATSPLNKGFTLIEVLIAVAILGIALIAVLKNTHIAIKNEEYLEQKTQAHWVAMNIITQATVGIINIPNPGNLQTGQATILSNPWNWQLTSERIPNTIILRLQVQVLNDQGSPIDTIETFITAPSNFS
jgi:general secretion pathway protein I